MDRTAIEKIEEIAIEALEVDTDFPAKALPNDCALHSLEPHMALRNRYRGKMATVSLHGFIDYVNDHDKAACFIDQEAMAATAFFNLGTQELPGHGDYRAHLELKPTAPYSALLDINGTRLKQKGIAEFLEDHRDFLAAIAADGSDMDLKRAIAIVRAITVDAHHRADHEDRDFGSSRSALEEIEAKSKNGESLPRSFVFSCTPYQGLDQRDFHIRLNLITGEEPVFTLRIIQLEQIREEMASEFRDTLEALFTSSTTPYLGRFNP